MNNEFTYLQDKNLYGMGRVLAKVSGTINHRDGYSTVSRFEDGSIVQTWYAETTDELEVDRAMRVMIMLPFSKGPELSCEWKSTVALK